MMTYSWPLSIQSISVSWVEHQFVVGASPWRHQWLFRESMTSIRSSPWPILQPTWSKPTKQWLQLLRRLGMSTMMVHSSCRPVTWATVLAATFLLVRAVYRSAPVKLDNVATVLGELHQETAPGPILGLQLNSIQSSRQLTNQPAKTRKQENTVAVMPWSKQINATNHPWPSDCSANLQSEGSICVYF